jgi:DNA polymerase-3 subunit epsilon/ATP-dependent DNA helicase DinG
MDFDARVHALVTQADEEQICWVELSSDGKKLALRSAPLDVGPLVEKHLWFEKDAVVMTSATLATAGDFNYIKGRLRAQDADELAVGSPFDYENSTLLYLPEDIPEPWEKERHQRALERGLLQLCRATGGRTLGLFTSHAQLRDTAQAIRGPLEREGIEVYAQTGSASRHQLLHAFSNAEKAVLLGARSFWEGVDVPGPALSVLLIARLPFDVPSDPIISARSESFENSFVDYSVPEAVLRFRQGFGRLIRTRSDRGVVVVFDRRVVSKRYGRLFLESLPGCRVQRGKLSLLPEAAVKWIDAGE